MTLAVAYRRAGPISSTSISKTVRRSPSRVSYERDFSRPCTMTRIPFCSDSATFSAACRQTAQLRNIASPSFHSPVCRSKVRGVEATVKLATGAPDGVKRSSGSAVRLPTRVMTVSPAMCVSVEDDQLVLTARVPAGTDSLGCQRIRRVRRVVSGCRAG